MLISVVSFFVVMVTETIATAHRPLHRRRQALIKRFPPEGKRNRIVIQTFRGCLRDFCFRLVGNSFKHR